MELESVIKRVLDGDQDAYRNIVKEYSLGVRIYLSGHLSDAHKVDDLCQETFIAVYCNLDTYNPAYSFKTWVQAIAKNKLMSYLRSHYSQQKMMVEIQSQITKLIDRESPMEGQEENMVEHLKTCISKQDEENANLLKLRYFEGVSVTDIAQQWSTTVSAISSQLYRLRKQLKNCIERSHA